MSGPTRGLESCRPGWSPIRPLAALVVTFALLVLLEFSHIPPLRFIDARTYMRWVKLDPDLVNLDLPAQPVAPGGAAPSTSGPFAR